MTQQSPCHLEPRFGGRRIGPTVGTPAYELVLNGNDHLLEAQLGVAMWADTVHRIAVATERTRR